MKLSPSAFVSCLVALVVGSLSLEALAVPYASGVRNTSGSMFQFVLNEPADKVTITRDGGNPLVIDNPAAGRHEFDLGTFSTYEIGVAKSAAPGWSTIHGAGNPFSNFTLPTGLAINTIPSSPYFGTVYVANANPVATVAGRAMGDGIYALTADMMGVDLANNFTKVTDANDTTQAKVPNFVVGTSASTTASPWRLSIDDGGNLIVADWSDAAGGIKWASPNLTMGGRVLTGVELDGSPVIEGNINEGQGTGRTGGVFSEEQDQFGRIPLHGSIASKVYVSGTVGVDLVIAAMDEDLDVNLSAPNGNDGNSIWRWTPGSATEFNALAPELVIDVGSLPPTTNGQPNFLNLNIGVSAGAHYDPGNDLWYLVQPRSAGTEACLIVVEADGVDGRSPDLKWSSLQFTIDNGFDANAEAGGIQDLFRNVRDVTISADGNFLVVNRSAATAAINGLGTGAVMLIPLDENGIPDITVEGGAITNVETLQLVNNNLGHNSGAQLEFDAAGNLYVAHSGLTTGNAAATAQLIQVFSPGGNTLATTRSDGTFDVDELIIGALGGDFNDDGMVDARDFVVWRNNLGLTTVLPNDDTPGVVDESDYLDWKGNYGMTAPAALALQTVPEPSSLLLAAIALGLTGYALRRRHRIPATWRASFS